MTLHHNSFLIIKPTRCTNFTNLFCYETPHDSDISSVHQLSCRSICSCSKAVYKPVWHIPLLSVQWINSWWWTEELSETCRFSCQNLHGIDAPARQQCFRQLSCRSICFCSKAVYKPVWHIPLLSVKWINSWWWTEELSETCRVAWQNKIVKLVHLFGLLQRKFRDNSSVPSSKVK